MSPETSSSFVSKEVFSKLVEVVESSSFELFGDNIIAIHYGQTGGANFLIELNKLNATMLVVHLIEWDSSIRDF